MNCAHCGRPNQPGDKFCAYCGQPLAPAPKFCTQCGAEIRPEARFCPQCGHAHTTDSGPAPSAVPPAPAQTKPAAKPAKPAHVAPVKLPPLTEIDKMYRQGASEQARDLLVEYVKRTPKEAAAWVVLGDCYRALDQDELAEQAYHTGLELDPEWARAYEGLGVVAGKKKDYTKALDYLTKAVQVDPESGSAWCHAAVTAMRIREDKAAVDFAERSYLLDKTDAKGAATLAAAYHYAGRIKDRDRMYQEARRLKYPDMDTLDKIFSGEITMRA
jgi:tetratricopeptide (TPR) repeat protein